MRGFWSMNGQQSNKIAAGFPSKTVNLAALQPNETVSARDAMPTFRLHGLSYTKDLPPERDANQRRWSKIEARDKETGAGMAIRLTLAAMAALAALTSAALAAKKPAEPVEATAPREAGEPIMAIVSIKSQRVTFYDAEGWILRAPVSTGTTGRETPAGVFAVIEKDKDHHSSMYDDAWMPNMQRITWNGIALHGGPLPGYAASHGCVRMPFPFAEKLFDKTRLGMRVIISPMDAEHSEPVEISHPLLFQPKADAIAAAPARIEATAREAEDAAKAAEEAKKAVATTAKDANNAAALLKKLEGQKKSADNELAYANKLLANAKNDQARTKAEELKAKAEPKAADAATAFEGAKADAATKRDAAAAAKDAAKATATKKADTAKTALDAKLALEPVSIYISRSTQKLYVRRNTHKPAPDGGGEVFDTSIEVPVQIRDAGRPIGTHIFTAMAKSDAGLRWSAVTIDAGDDAKDALDRVSIPQEVLDRIAPTALPRSSIVISDEPLSKETNYRTEFVAVLNNQPQGGFITRKPTPPEMMMAGGNSSWGEGSIFGGFFQPNYPPNPPPQPANARRRGGGQYYYQQQPGIFQQQQPGYYQRW
jgi:lipoprotein-anchoring transpeptidase ErfK/SrfK